MVMPPPVLTTLVSRSRAFESLAAPAAILDTEARIVTVNEAWQTFADLNGAVDRQLRVGSDYRSLWDGTDGDLAEALTDVIEGRRTHHEVERWWPSPVEDRWVLVRIVPLVGSGERGAVVVHLDITARKLLEQRLADEDGTDAGTGLRTEFEPVADAVGTDAGGPSTAAPVLAVVAVHVGGLDDVERRFGRPSAEQVFVHVVARVRRLVRPGDVLWRVGPRDLAVAGAGVGDGVALAERLRVALVDRYQVGAGQVDLAFVVEARPIDAGADLLEAVRAVSRVSSRPIPAGSVRRTTPRRNVERSRPSGSTLDRSPSEAGRARLEAIARSCVQADEVPLVFQPITRFADRAVVGAEALLRVVDQDGAAVPPLDLVATADRLGLGPALGRLVVESACREAARWQQAVPELQLSMAVNLSPAQFRDRGVADQVGAALAASDLEPARLSLEVSERDLVDDPAWSSRQLALLKMLGVQLTVDDYGTGHASLIHLRRFPVDALKVDLSLVAGLPENPEDLAILAATMGVAEAFGLQVVAKGVEHDRQLAELGRLGCRYGQGFLWSTALPGEAFLERVLAGADAAADPVEVDRSPAGSSGEVDELDAVLRSLVHEIRTPLTVAMGYASLLESSVDPDQVAVAANIRRATERINHLLGNLEDVRLIDQGALDLEPHRVDLRTVVEDVAADLRSVVRVPLVVEHGTDLPVLVDADEVRIGQVIANLVTNAAKFSSRTGPVLLRVDARGDWAEVAVSDDGPGLAQEDLGLVFRKYGRADRTHQGTGLGLYLSRGTARAHGGDVRYSRRLGGDGSTFTLQLPRPGSDR